MRILLLVMTILLAGLALGQDDPTYGKSLDFEVGYQMALGESASTGLYGIGRANLPLALELAGAKAWLLPELALFVDSPLAGYGRVQLMLDHPFSTFFIDCRAQLSGEAFCRTGVRFNTDW